MAHAISGGCVAASTGERAVDIVLARRRPYVITATLPASGAVLGMQTRLRFALMAAFAAMITSTLAACGSTSAAPTGAAGGGGTVSSASTAGSGSSTAARAASGTVSTDGVCGLVPIASVDSTLGRTYVNSKLVAVPASAMADTSYCDYTPASGAGEFQIQVAKSDPTGATGTFNDATGGKLVSFPGIGDSALYAASFPELVVVYGQTTIAVGQSSRGSGDSPITQEQLKKLVAAVHAAG